MPEMFLPAEEADDRELTALEQLNIHGAGAEGQISVEWFRMLARSRLTNEEEHSHAGIELHFLLSGRHTFYAAKEAMPLEAMEGVMIPSGCRHRLHNTGGAYVRYVLNFHLDPAREDSGEGFLLNAFRQQGLCRFPLTQTMAALLRECSKEAEETYGGFMTILEGNVWKLLVLTAREVCGGSFPTADAVPRRKALSRSLAEEAETYMDAHLSDSMAVGDIARYMHMTDKQLQRVFRRQYDSTVGRVLEQKRLAKAKELLRSTNMTIYEIALSTGFSSKEGFSRFFSRMEGQSPHKYRLGALSQN